LVRYDGLTVGVPPRCLQSKSYTAVFSFPGMAIREFPRKLERALIDRTYALSDVAAAQEKLAAQRQFGKLVLTPRSK